VQRMSAGTGVTHSEFNASDRDPVHFLQIWIEPATRGLAPGYEEKRFDSESKRGRLRLIASPDGRDGSVTIHQDASVYSVLLDGGDAIEFEQRSGRRTYVHVVRGEVEVGGQPLATGDAAKFTAETRVRLANARGAEVLLFDLA
jgi:quercetin 2,3-dioxygenase